MKGAADDDDDVDGELREKEVLMAGHRRKRRKGVRLGSLIANLDYSESGINIKI